jgi:nitrate/nitrite transporter NarK
MVVVGGAIGMGGDVGAIAVGAPQAFNVIKSKTGQTKRIAMSYGRSQDSGFRTQKVGR